MDTIPGDCFPILMSFILNITAEGNWAACSVSFGTSGNILSIGIKDNWVGGNGDAYCSYIPFNCKNYEELINVKLVTKQNRPVSLTMTKYYIWAEK